MLNEALQIQSCIKNVRWGTDETAVEIWLESELPKDGYQSDTGEWHTWNKAAQRFERDAPRESNCYALRTLQVGDKRKVTLFYIPQMIRID